MLTRAETNEKAELDDLLGYVNTIIDAQNLDECAQIIKDTHEKYQQKEYGWVMTNEE